MTMEIDSSALGAPPILRTKARYLFWMGAVFAAILASIYVSSVVVYLLLWAKIIAASSPETYKSIALCVAVAILVWSKLIAEKYWAWTLEERTLTRGNPPNLTINLSRVQRVFWVYLAAQKYLILEIEADTFFALNLYEFGNGFAVMRELERRFSDKIAISQSGVFSNFSALRKIKSNQIVRLKNPATK